MSLTTHYYRPVDISVQGISDGDGIDEGIKSSCIKNLVSYFPVPLIWRPSIEGLIFKTKALFCTVTWMDRLDNRGLTKTYSKKVVVLVLLGWTTLLLQ